MEEALKLVRRGGRVLIISMFIDDVPIRMGRVQVNEIEGKGSNT
jgi:threonine dehydrogenase-like Zn-dependent dehydrogenase